MKILFSVLAIVMLNKECNQHKAKETTSNTINSEKMSEVTQDYTKVWYEATTRGFYEKIWISKDSITITNDRNQKIITNYLVPEKDWNELINLLKDVNIEEMPNLEAPTSKRHYDGAAFATLAVSQNKIETISNNFDHGYPPKAIEVIVNKVLSIKEKHEKN